MVKSKKSRKCGKISKNKKNNKINTNYDGARILRSNKKNSNRCSTIEELLKLCKPLTVRLSRCDYMLKQSSKKKII